MKTERRLSVVVACYRDAGSVVECHRRLTEVLSAITPNYEIIYANDASPDNAEEILNGIAATDPHLVIVNHTRNFGSQNAFLSGMRISRGDGVILMDGDLQDPPQVIPELVDAWLAGAHVVYGVRIKRIETRFRQVAYKVFYRIFRRMADFPVPVDAGDFGLMDRKVVNVLLNDFPESRVFLRGLRAYTGFKHVGVPYVRAQRFDGVTTNSLRGNLRWAKLAIFSFSHRPLDYISRLAIFCVVVTAVLGLVLTVIYVISLVRDDVTAPPGFMSLLLVSMFLGSAQLICLSILAEYLGHMYDEIKRRPRYIVRDIVDNRERLEHEAPGPDQDGQ